MRSILFLALFASALMADFDGKWASNRTDASGSLKVKFESPAELTFTLNGQEFKTTVTKAVLKGEAFEIEYSFEIEGYKLLSVAKGAVKDGKLDGTYETKSVGDGAPVDTGTVQASSSRR